jgi:hypothetical protein
LGYSEKAIKEFYDDPDTMIDDLSKYYYIYNRRHYVKMIKDIINSNDYKKFKQKIGVGIFFFCIVSPL